MVVERRCHDGLSNREDSHNVAVFVNSILALQTLKRELEVRRMHRVQVLSRRNPSYLFYATLQRRFQHCNCTISWSSPQPQRKIMTDEGERVHGLSSTLARLCLVISEFHAQCFLNHRDNASLLIHRHDDDSFSV
jgi:hypothetical protein